MLAWVIVAGWPISDSTPPKLSARLKSRVREKVPGRLAASFEPDADHAAEIAHLPPGHVVVGMVGEAGIVNSSDPGMLAQPGCERPRIGTVALHPNRKGFDPAQDEPCVKRSGHAARGILIKRDWLEQLPAAGHRATDHIGMASQILGRAMNHQVRPELERPLEAGRGEGIINGEEVHRSREPRRRSPRYRRSGAAGLSAFQSRRVSSPARRSQRSLPG